MTNDMKTTSEKTQRASYSEEIPVRGLSLRKFFISSCTPERQEALAETEHTELTEANGEIRKNQTSELLPF